MVIGGLALIKTDATAYLTDDSEYTLGVPFGLGHAEANIIEDGDIKAAFASAGVSFEAKFSDGGSYIGTASYLMMEGEVEFNENDFWIEGEKYSSCITINDDADACGDKRKAVPGTYKFSLYGYTGDMNWENVSG